MRFAVGGVRWVGHVVTKRPMNRTHSYCARVTMSSEFLGGGSGCSGRSDPPISEHWLRSRPSQPAGGSPAVREDGFIQPEAASALGLGRNGLASEETHRCGRFTGRSFGRRRCSVCRRRHDCAAPSSRSHTLVGRESEAVFSRPGYSRARNTTRLGGQSSPRPPQLERRRVAMPDRLLPWRMLRHFGNGEVHLG